MRKVCRLARLGFVFLATLFAAGQAKAANTPISTGASVALSYTADATIGTTYQYGNTTFAFTNCHGCGDLELVALMNGRGGTEVEIAQNPTTSDIFSTSSVGASLQVSFSVTVGMLAGTQGISSVTNILDGSDSNPSNHGSNNGQVTSLSGSFSSLPGLSASSITSNLGVTSSNVTFNPTTNSFTFSQTLSNNGPVSGSPGTLKLTDVRLLFNPAPEPASIALFATGLLGLTAARRRFFRSQR